MTCKLLRDKPRLAEFAACSDSPVVAFSRCSAVLIVPGSCCKPSPSLQFAEIGKVALLSATFATCQLLADCEIRFHQLQQQVQRAQIARFSVAQLCQPCWAVAVGLPLRCSSHELAKKHYCHQFLRPANFLLLMHKGMQRLQLAPTHPFVRVRAAR